MQSRRDSAMHQKRLSEARNLAMPRGKGSGALFAIEAPATPHEPKPQMLPVPLVLRLMDKSPPDEDEGDALAPDAPIPYTPTEAVVPVALACASLGRAELEGGPVDHPPHYQHPSGVECIDVAEHMDFCRGNALKYIWRAGQKGDEIEDLRKARWYLDREIARLVALSERNKETP